MYLYVMGRGHSGSTILDILLGGGAAVESVGELVSGLERYEAGDALRVRRADAGVPVLGRGPPPLRGRGPRLGRLRAREPAPDDVRRWPATWLAGPGRPRAAPARRLTRCARCARSPALSGKPHLLDSNKEVARGLFLLRYLPEARVVHLVGTRAGIQRSHHWRLRDRRGFLFMRRRFAGRGTRPPPAAARGPRSWTAGNAAGAS